MVVVEAIFMFVLYVLAALLQLFSEKLIFGIIMFLIPLFSFYSEWFGVDLTIILLVFAVFFIAAKIGGGI